MKVKLIKWTQEHKPELISICNRVDRSYQRVLEKNGFVREGFQKDAVFKDDKVMDLCLFGKLK